MPDDSDNAVEATAEEPTEQAFAVGENDSRLRQMMSQYFLEYASYVIKDRAIPDLDDGLKPVQRRILQALYDKEDGRFHKVANIVGHTMQYHPHGDASIYDALVTLANKEFFIDKQGNFGNLFTGDSASASRYIECRLSPLARETLFNPEITEFVATYDSRNQEPVTLPAKVPVLLMQGTEGIAVGMATRILPHNFGELLDAQIRILKGQPFRIYPDFYQGGVMDVGEYDQGNGKVRLRSVIEKRDAKTLVVREIPYGTTTESIVASIQDMAQKGKVKIAAIDDYTAEAVEIEIKLPRGANADRTIKALYAYTQCEVSISCNCLVIRENRPEIMNVLKVLEHCTEKLQRDLQRELEIYLAKLEDLFHAKTLAQIFVENRIYKRIEECESQETIFREVHDGLAPFRPQLRRDVTDDDVEKLLALAIRRISLFDINKNRQDIEKIMADMEEANYNLEHLQKFAINYVQAIRDKYAYLYPRRTRIENMEEVNVREVALTNIRVGHDRGSGYLGTAVKSDETIVCTEYDKLVVLGSDGVLKVVPIPEKVYIGSVCAVFKLDREQVYGMVYRDRRKKTAYAKRFRIQSFIMEKEYNTVPKGCRIEKFFDRYGVVLRCEFVPAPRLRQPHIDLDLETVPIRGLTARGLKIDNRIISKFLQLKRGTESAPDDAAEEPPEEPEEVAQTGQIPVTDTLQLLMPQPLDDQEPARLPDIQQPREGTGEETLFRRASAFPKSRRKRAQAVTGSRKHPGRPKARQVTGEEPPPAEPSPKPTKSSPRRSSQAKSGRPSAPPAQPEAVDTPSPEAGGEPAKSRFRIDEDTPFELG